MTTTTNKWMVRSAVDHTILTVVPMTKAACQRVIRACEAAGRTDLELVRVNW